MPTRVMRRLTGVVVACALGSSLAACSSNSTGDGGAQDASGPIPVSIGLAVPMTPGADAAEGLDMLAAAELAVADANNSSEVEAAGLLILLEPLDTKDDLETGFDVASELVDNERVIAVVGHPSNDVALFVSSVYEEGGLPLLAMATTPLLTERDYDYIDRMVPREDVHGTVVAEVARRTLEATSAVVVTDGTFHGAASADRFTEAFVEDGGTITARFETDTDQVRAVAERIAAQTPSVVFIGSEVAPAAGLSAELHALGVDVPVMVKGACTGSDYLSLAGEAAEGDVGVRSAVDLTGSARGRDFIAYFDSAYGRAPIPCAAYAYDAVTGIVRAVLEAGADRTPVAEALRTMEFAGVTGTWRFDAAGDTTNLEVSVLHVVDGAWVTLP